LGARGHLEFFDELGVASDGIAPSAKPAINRAGIKGKKKRLVRVAVGETGHGRVFLFMQRIEPEFGMIGFELRSEREELGADRVRDGIPPVDETD